MRQEEEDLEPLKMRQEEEDLEPLKMRQEEEDLEPLKMRQEEEELEPLKMRQEEEELEPLKMRQEEEELEGALKMSGEQGLGRSGAAAAAAATDRGMRLPLLIASCLHRRLPVFRLALGGVQRALQEPQNRITVHGVSCGGAPPSCLFFRPDRCALWPYLHGRG